MGMLKDGTETVNEKYLAQRDYEHQIESLRRWYPEYRIVEVAGGGFLAFPVATPHTDARTLDDLVTALAGGQLSPMCPCSCHRKHDGRCVHCCDGVSR